MAALLGTLAAVAMMVPTAAATPGPSSLSAGFVEDSLFAEYPPTQVPEAWFARLAHLGSTWVRLGAYWGAIAPAQPSPGSDATNPANPGYDWTYLDESVRAAAAYHLHVLMTIQWPPPWALGPNAPASAIPHTWRPDAAAFGRFAGAVARRYDGSFPDPWYPGSHLPRVSYFQAWNEPNLWTALQPQWTRTRHGLVPASPGIYRALLNAAYVNIKSVQPHAVVLAAGLAPYGDPPGGNRMPPVVFMRELLCLRGAALHPERCPNVAHLDGIDLHPYALVPTVHARRPDDVSVPDLGRLTRVIAAAQRTHRVLPRGHKVAWETEIDWDSSPPDPKGFSLSTQARFLSLAFYELWRQGVSHVFWYEVRDPGRFAFNLTGGGLFFVSSAPKPVTNAFAFPFVALRGAHGRTTLWGRAPASGRVTIEALRGHRWHPLLTLRTTAGGVFYAIRSLPAGLKLRARRGGSISYPY